MVEDLRTSLAWKAAINPNTTHTAGHSGPGDAGQAGGVSLYLLRNKEGEKDIKIPEKNSSNDNQIPQNIFKFKICLLARLF